MIVISDSMWSVSAPSIMQNTTNTFIPVFKNKVVASEGGARIWLGGVVSYLRKLLMPFVTSQRVDFQGACLCVVMLMMIGKVKKSSVCDFSNNGHWHFVLFCPSV